MAAGAGYIEFSTGDILTASAANSYLASQVVMVFADASARTSAITSPQEGMVSYLKDTNAVEYYTGSAWAAVGGGGGGGKVLQVVQATSTTATTIATTTYTDTNLSASITPSATTSKVLVLVNQQRRFSKNGNDQGIGIRIMRNGSSVFSAAGSDFNYAGTSGTSIFEHSVTALSYLDSPATTSAITYKTQGNINDTSSSGSSVWQQGSNPSTITLLEIGA